MKITRISLNIKKGYYHQEQAEEIVQFVDHHQENLVLNMHIHQIHLRLFPELVYIYNRTTNHFKFQSNFTVMMDVMENKVLHVLTNLFHPIKQRNKR